MMEVIVPESEAHWRELRSKVITSTDVPALFGASPYKTKFELWHEKKEGKQDLGAGGDRIKWGKRLETAIANGIAEDNGFTARPMKEFISWPKNRIGSSFDFAIDPNGILEIKNVDSLAFKQGWLLHEDGELESPLHIELQAQTQLYVSQRDYLYIGALVGGNRTVLLKRTPDQSVVKAICKKIDEFWCSIDANIPPEPDFSRDAEFIKSLYQAVNADKKVLEVEDNHAITQLAADYKNACEAVSLAESNKAAIHAKLLTLVGDNDLVQAGDYKISSSYTPQTQISYERKGFRTMRITKKSGQQE